MRVLFISTVYPDPADVGKKIVVSGLCRYFAEKCGKENFILACTDQLPTNPLWNAIALPRPTRVRQLGNIVWHTLISRRKSLQESVLYAPSIRKQLSKMLTELEPDLIVFDTVRMGQYAEELSKGGERRFLYLEDLFSVRYGRMLEAFSLASRYSSNPLGNFSRNLPKAASWVVKRLGWLQQLLLRFEKGVVEQSENRQVHGFDGSLLISSEEVKVLKERAQCKSVFALPPRSRDDIRSLERTWCGEPEFVFLGSLNLPHNAASIENFLTEHFAEVREQIPQVRLRIIGRHASASLVEMISRFDGSVSLEGFVDEIEPVLLGCCGLVVPLLFGSGVKLKMIDALACGVPFVSTCYGVEGIACKDGVHGVFEDSLDRFPLAMKKLLDRDINEQMSGECQELFRSNYSVDATRNYYDRIFLK